MGFSMRWVYKFPWFEFGRPRKLFDIYSNSYNKSHMKTDFFFSGSEDWKYGDEWHYIKAFEAFKKMYPRISTGRPLDPWRAVQRDVKGTQMKSTKPWQDTELEPLNSEPGHDYAGR